MQSFDSPAAHVLQDATGVLHRMSLGEDIMKITNADLTGMLERVARAMQSAGLDTTHLHLEQGSKTYGRAYRLYLRDPQTGGLGTVPGMSSSGYLGMTKTEAYQSLHMLAQGVEMATAGRGAN